MDDEFKREYKKLTGNLEGTPKDDESKSPESGQLTQTTQIVDKGFKGVKGIGTVRGVEQLLVEELKKLDVKPEVKVKFDRPYKYPRPYYADVKVGKLAMDVLGKSSEEERVKRDKYFIKQGMYPIHFPPPMVKKYAPVIASLIHVLIKYGAS